MEAGAGLQEDREEGGHQRIKGDVGRTLTFDPSRAPISPSQAEFNVTLHAAKNYFLLLRYFP